MRDYQLGFISNENIFKHVKDTVKLYRTFIDLKSYNPQNEMFQRFKTKCSFLQNEAYLCKSFFLP